MARPTLYDWLRGREPNGANAGRVDTTAAPSAVLTSETGSEPMRGKYSARLFH